MNGAEEIIARLQLEEHPEGGYFRETYRSEGRLEVDGKSRSHSTCIYFLLTAERPSRFHRIRSDELWHFYDGSAILLHEITAEGAYRLHRIGRNLSAGEIPPLGVSAGSWFASEVENGWSLAGCTVSPGFDFEDFEMAVQEDMLAQFPEHKQVILRLTSAF